MTIAAPDTPLIGTHIREAEKLVALLERVEAVFESSKTKADEIVEWLIADAPFPRFGSAICEQADRLRRELNPTTRQNEFDIGALKNEALELRDLMRLGCESKAASAS